MDGDNTLFLILLYPYGKNARKVFPSIGSVYLLPYIRIFNIGLTKKLILIKNPLENMLRNNFINNCIYLKKL